jgi:acetyltransferase-like isoleucine patch superfamily enzyme
VKKIKVDNNLIVNRLLFDYDSLSEQEIEKLIALLPRKIIRWLGMNHANNRTRKIFFCATGVKIGKGVVLNPNLVIADSYKNLVTIGDRVSIAPNVMIIADTGPNNSKLQDIPYIKEQIIKAKPVVIDDDAWIGAGAIILPGVVIGSKAIVGAGSVVTKSVEPYTIVAGVPARRIRTIEPNK